MSIWMYLAIFFVAGMMCHRFASRLEQPMEWRNIAGLCVNGAEILALASIFRHFWG